jgi:hypothetical protein
MTPLQQAASRHDARKCPPDSLDLIPLGHPCLSLLAWYGLGGRLILSASSCWASSWAIQ